MNETTKFRDEVEARCRDLGHPRMSWYERDGEAGPRTIRFIARSCPCGAFLDVSSLEEVVASAPTPITSWREPTAT